MIIPTGRLLLIALAGILPVAITGSTNVSIFVAIMWAVMVISLVVLDGLLTPPHHLLSWTRKHDDKLYLGVWNNVDVRLQNQSKQQAIFQVRDVTPSMFLAEGSRTEGRCAALGHVGFRYRILPLHRGAYQLGPLAARFRGPLGLAWRQHSWREPKPVSVYPNLLAVRSYESLVRRGYLHEIGVRNARRLGGGTEFDHLRDYGPDDDYRRINWKATARTGRAISTVYRTERAQNVILALDAGRLMATPVRLEGLDPLASGTPPAISRFDYALNATLLLSFVSQQTGDRTGLVCFGDGIVRYLSPRPGRSSFLSITHALHDVEPTLTEADYSTALRYVAAKNAQRSLIVLFTDVSEPEAAEPLIEPVSHLSKHHLILIVTMRDPDLDRMANQLPEDTSSVYERAVARTVMDHRERTLRLLRDRRVLTLDVVADKLSSETVNRYLEIKARHLL